MTPTDAPREASRLVLAIGLASAGLHAVTYLASRAMFRNGLALKIGGVTVAGDPASVPRLAAQLLAYGAATLAAFALYAWLLRICRVGRLAGPRALALALLFPVLFNLGLWLAPPTFSIDAYSYVAEGYLGSIPGRNPYVEGVEAHFVTTPVPHWDLPPGSERLLPFGWRPVHGLSPYGPLWVRFEIAVARLNLSVPAAILVLKAAVILASLLVAVLIAAILGQVRPGERLFGMLAWLWNPVVLFEFAGEGHNDAGMIALALLSLFLAVRGRAAGSMVSVAFSALIKCVPVVFVPAQVVFLWRARSRGAARLALGIAVGVVVGLGAAVVVYQPLWAGWATFGGLREVARPRVAASGAMVLHALVRRVAPDPAGVRWTFLLSAVAFAAFVLRETLAVGDAASLHRALGRIALAFVLVASPTWWSWYVTLPLALLALAPLKRFGAMLVVLGVCSRFAAPFDVCRVNGFWSWRFESWAMTAIGIGVPLLYLLLDWWRRRASGEGAPLGGPP